ncbi:MAG: membrane dipeptidase [Trueperaceae bacterium]
MIIVDGHLDLALNALQGNRDLTVSAYETRIAEFGRVGKGMAQGTVALPEMRQGRVALSFAVLTARSTGCVAPHMDFASAVQADASAHGHLAYYRALEAEGHARLITDRQQLDHHIFAWHQWEQLADGVPAHADMPPLGFVVLMESADPVLAPDRLEVWWDEGLRIIGPAHFGSGRYAGGTGSEQGLTPMGRELLAEMDRLGFILDLTHLSDASFWEALERFEGPVLASHSNCRTLVPNQRQFGDSQIAAVVERGGVVGVLLGCSDLVADWVVGARHNGAVTMRAVVDHIEHACSVAGDALHVAIGTDLDGGVGRDEFPRDLDTIADLQSLPRLLQERGFSAGDVDNVMHGNWLRCLRGAWSSPAAARQVDG